MVCTDTPLNMAGLPGDVPVFPLPGVLLLPGGQLPLNVFEDRYIRMVDDVLGGDRMIGVVQPRDTTSDSGNGALFNIGCAGRITHFAETGDGRYTITLTGICRFALAGELDGQNGYRRVRPDWADFEKDLRPENCLDLDRQALKDLLAAYFDIHGLSCEWDKIDGAPDGRLISCLSMICPLDPGEKQALLEAEDCRARADLFMTILDMAVRAHKHQGGCH